VVENLIAQGAIANYENDLLSKTALMTAVENDRL